MHRHLSTCRFASAATERYVTQRMYDITVIKRFVPKWYTCHITVQSQNSTCRQRYSQKNVTYENPRKTYCLQNGTANNYFLPVFSVFPLLPVPFYLCRSDRPVLAVLFWLSHFFCPVQAILCQQSCAGSPVRTVPFCHLCPGSFVLQGLF